MTSHEEKLLRGATDVALARIKTLEHTILVERGVRVEGLTDGWDWVECTDLSRHEGMPPKGWNHPRIPACVWVGTLQGRWTWFWNVGNVGRTPVDTAYAGLVAANAVLATRGKEDKVLGVPESVWREAGVDPQVILKTVESYKESP